MGGRNPKGINMVWRNIYNCYSVCSDFGFVVVHVSKMQTRDFLQNIGKVKHKKQGNNEWTLTLSILTLPIDLVRHITWLSKPRLSNTS